jgi:hypothetical protein
MILYYRLMTKWSGLGDSTELSLVGLSQRTPCRGVHPERGRRRRRRHCVGRRGRTRALPVAPPIFGYPGRRSLEHACSPLHRNRLGAGLQRGGGREYSPRVGGAPGVDFRVSRGQATSPEQGSSDQPVKRVRVRSSM